MAREDFIEKILQVAGDYRKGEIAPFNAAHVEKWVNQFPVSEVHKDVILGEVGHMLGNFYISRDNAKEKIRSMFRIMKEERAGNCSTYDVNFLRTQETGKSQAGMLSIADDILREDSGKSTKDCGGSKVYLYLDDCVYSGNKLRYDICNSTQLDEIRAGSTLITYHFGLYGTGFGYASGHVEKYMAKNKGIYKPFRSEWWNNDRSNGKTLDVVWPTYVKGDSHIDAFINRANANAAGRGWNLRVCFRTEHKVSSKIFTSPEDQHIVEQAFLKVGARLFCAAANPAPSMRPMGFEVLTTVGFGTPIVTWRNIANNCPLALWYGDPSFGPSHPLGMWYPLFPRKM